MGKIRIPDSELTKRVIYQTLKDYGIVRTQEELAELVEGELKRLDDKYEITPRRARKLAMDIAGLKVQTERRKGTDEPPEVCPACGSDLHETVSTNLKGERVVVGKNCTGCDYVTDLTNFAPRRYEFRLLKESE